MAYKSQPRDWPEYIKGCLSCHCDSNHKNYGARGLCWTCYKRERRNGTTHRWHKVVQSSTDNELLQLAKTLGKTEVCAMLDIDAGSLVKWIKNGAPRKRREEITEHLIKIKKLSALSQRNERSEPLPYREKETKERPWYFSSDFPTGVEP